MIDFDNLNDGDKFILRMNDLEKNKYFEKRHLKYTRDFKILDNSVIKSNFGKEASILHVFENLGLKKPLELNVKNIDTFFEDYITKLVFYFEISIQEINIPIKYTITYNSLKNKDFKTKSKIDSKVIVLKEYTNIRQKNQKFLLDYEFDNDSSLLVNLVNLNLYLESSKKHLEKFVTDYNNKTLDSFFKKWKINLLSNKEVLNKTWKLFPKFAKFGMDYNRFFGIISAINNRFLSLDEILDVIITDSQNNFQKTDFLLENFLKTAYFYDYRN